LELATLAALLASLMSLLAVIHSAFFGSEMDFRQRIYNSLGMLLLAAGFALFAGLLIEGHREGAQSSSPVAAIFRTFPVRAFFWTTRPIVALLLLAWWIEAYCVFSPEMRF